jgi:hypothetical protein
MLTLNKILFSFLATVSRQVIRETFKYYSNHSCLKFVESSTAIPRIQFRMATTGCFSYVGFLGSSWYGAPSSQTGCSVCSGYGLHPINLGEDFCDDEVRLFQTLSFSTGFKRSNDRFNGWEIDLSGKLFSPELLGLKIFPHSKFPRWCSDKEAASWPQCHGFESLFEPIWFKIGNLEQKDFARIPRGNPNPVNNRY